jgi:PDZ domain-containing protein
VNRRLRVQLVAGILLAGAVCGAVLLPVPFVAISPGPVFDTLSSGRGNTLITVTGVPTYRTSGTLDLTTVRERGEPVDQLTLVHLVSGWINPHTAVVPHDMLYPPSASKDDVEQQNQEDFVASKDAAAVAGLRAAGIAVTTTVTVADLVAGGASAGVLKKGDVIAAVDGTAVADGAALRTALATHKPGDTIALTIVRGKATRQVGVVAKADPADATHAVIGIEVGEGYTSTATVTIQLDRVGGPSAGLMFSLGVYDKVTPGELTGGLTVAGTGTMDVDGAVGAIGGIQQKMRGARSAGATVFLVPADNCKDAKAARPDGLRLVKVAKLSDATSALTALAANPKASVPTC